MPDLTWPQLIGFTVRDAPPIRKAFIDAQPGLTVLYGRNGAGKTRLLTTIAECLQPLPPRGRELTYQWLPPWDVISELPGPERLRYLSTPGYPWRISFEPDLSGNALEFVLSYMEEYLHSLDKLFISSPLVRNLARQITVEAAAWNADPESLPEIARACEEIAAAGVWRRTRSSGSIVTSGAAVESVAARTDVTPTFNQLWERVREARLAALAENGWEEPVETTNALGLGFFGHVTASVDAGLFRDHPQLYDEPPSWIDLDAPWWYGDTAAAFDDSGVPAVLVTEEDSDLTVLTIDTIERRLGEDGNPVSFSVERAPGWEVHPALGDVASSLGKAATAYARLLLEEAPPLHCRVRPVGEWHRHLAVDWVAADPTGAMVSLDGLSRAEARWSRFAIRLALLEENPLPTVILLDEPEAALHRRAERHLARGLQALAEAHGATVIVATHSPTFLDQRQCRLVHVARGADGFTELLAMPPVLRDRIDELGLEPTDLLQLCRTVLLVEGQHELVVFEELFGDVFRRHGVEVFSIRGARNLANAADAQLLFGYTNADVVVVVDNEDAERVSEIWRRACDAADAGGIPLEVLMELTAGKKNAEAVFLREFCTLAVEKGQRHRIRFQTLSLPDLPEYLAVHDIAPSAPVAATWEQLRERHVRSGTKMAFKAWMQHEFDADYSDENLRLAASRLDALHLDLVALVQSVAPEGTAAI